MSKTCARCGKTVYSIEELKCLDKIWHKQCFKCQVCQMTLNMRNYKGFDKEPYCEAHIPKAKATTVAETPEFKRIAENTKIQSNVKYHADFEKAKGKFTQVADDPETLRIKENSKNISNVAYHGELQKKADMERQRNITDAPKGHPGFVSDGTNGGYQQQPRSNIPTHHPQTVAPMNVPNPISQHHGQKPSNVIYTSERGAVATADRRFGSIQDFDPVNEYYGSLSADSYSHSQHSPQQHHQHQHHQQSQRYYAPPQEIPQNKMSAGYGDPMAANRRDFSNYTTKNGRPGGQGPRGQSAYSEEYSDASYNEPPPAPQPTRNSGRVFRAMYEYKAQDVDEVSFIEGDFIINCTPIDEGWLSGVVQRTGKKGMLPANYVTPAI